MWERSMKSINNTCCSVVLLLILLHNISVFSSVQEINSFNEAQDGLNQSDEDTLVVFDIDYTLITPKDACLQNWFDETEHGKHLIYEREKYLSCQNNAQSYRQMILSQRLLACQMDCVESQVPHIIKRLQERRVRVIALTHSPTSSFGNINGMHKLRRSQLAQVGIDFDSKFFPKKIFFIMNTGTKKPLFYRGILMTDLVDKGLVLGCFLDILKRKPRKIIFFDDRRCNVYSVVYAAMQKNISCNGFICKAAEQRPKVFDSEVTTIQNQFLTYLGEYKSEEEIRILLAQGAQQNHSCSQQFIETMLNWVEALLTTH